MSRENYNLEPQELGHTIQILMDAIKKGDEILEFTDINKITDEDRIKYNDSIILKPEYQREYRSTIKEESSLIESVLLGIPIPPIFLASNKMYDIQVLNVVDGQHRLGAFYRFMNNVFQLKELPILKDLCDKRFKDLDLNDKQKIMSHKLPSYVFRDFPGKECELEIFNRYNKGTKPLSQQEIRNAVYNSSYNEYINLFIKKLTESDDSNDLKLKKAYNVTTDRQLKKKAHESLFVILYILEKGINENFKDSTSYSESYMKLKSERDVKEEFEIMQRTFDSFNQFLLKIIDYVEYPFSKEIYGIESRNYKFQMSIAMILAAIFKKSYLSMDLDSMDVISVLQKIKEKLTDSFLEDSNYKASTTNSKKLNELILSF